MATATKEPETKAPKAAAKAAPKRVAAAKTDDKVPKPPANQPVADREPAARAIKVTRRVAPAPKEPPDLVQVRAIEKGQYGLDTDIIIRNPGEVFDMATSAMRKWPLEKGEHPVEGATIIETEKGKFELPGWVELVEPDEQIDPADLVSHGHAKSLRGQTTEAGRSIEVL